MGLTEEEKQTKFRKPKIHDLGPAVMSANFPKFTLPTVDEGFDAVRFDWLKDQAKCQEYLKAYVQERKLSTRVEDIKPSTEFQERKSKWLKVLAEWNTKLNQHNAAVARKAEEKARKETAKRIAERKKKMEDERIAMEKARAEAMKQKEAEEGKTEE